MRVAERAEPASSGTRKHRAVTSVAVLVAFLIGAFGLRWAIQRTREDPVFRPELAHEFFRRYVREDGRVTRPENGSDTVSEGQAYAMLLAVALDDPGRFATVWRWTDSNMRRPDGLLSWRWADGRIAGAEPAADADVDAAMALLIAAERFGEPSYSREGRRIADAILRSETLEVAGRRVLVAGPWARDRRLINPSYFWPEAFARFPGDGWDDVHRSSVDLAKGLAGRSLPPDWAHVEEDGSATPADDPTTSGRGAGYFLDAPRLIVRFAASCDPDARALAASSLPMLDGRDLTHPVHIVAAAAAAHAGGDAERRAELLERAHRTVSDHPSYYGWAWVALGPAMLDEGSLVSCS